MPGELIDIGKRPKQVASFASPGAAQRFAEWREANAEKLASVPVEALRVEYAYTGAGINVRVRVDEAHVPPGLEGPDEIGAAAGLPPRPPAA